MDTLKLVDKLYYTVTPANPDIVTVYTIVDNTPLQVFEFEFFISSYYGKEESIQSWLDENGYEDFEYEFIRL